MLLSNTVLCFPSFIDFELPLPVVINFKRHEIVVIRSRVEPMSLVTLACLKDTELCIKTLIKTLIKTYSRVWYSVLE